jgi:hypothetical protein
MGSSIYSLGADPTENTVSQQYFHCLALTRWRGNVFTQSFHSNCCTRYIPLPIIPLLLRALPSNGCFSGSTVLALSKYGTIITDFCDGNVTTQFQKNRHVTKVTVIGLSKFSFHHCRRICLMHRYYEQ